MHKKAWLTVMLCAAAAAAADSAAFRSMDETLSAPTSRQFWVARDATGRFTTGNPVSYYSRTPDDENLTFDVSNGRVLVNLGVQGTIKFITYFRATYWADLAPGGWVKWDKSTSGPYSFAVATDGHHYDLVKGDLPLKTSFLGNLFPFTAYRGDKVDIKLLAFAPLSADGRERPRAAIYGLWLKNKSTGELKGSIRLPADPVGQYGEELTSHAVTMALMDSAEAKKPAKVDFQLAAGKSIWVPLVIASPGDWATIAEVRKVGSLEWLKRTWTYFNGITGRLSMPSDPFTEEFLVRSVIHCIASAALDDNGAPAGVGYGTYPPVDSNNWRDMYFSMLPALQFEPRLFGSFIPWFLKYAIRPAGDFFAGGVSHSLSNSLNPVLMSGLYYAATGDRTLFLENPQLKPGLVNILEQVLASRQPSDAWLFPSRYISDGRSLGDYHTGSNVCAWFAFKSFARVLEEVYGDKANAERYREIAGRIRNSLESHNVIDGPFGKQYIEGVNRDGSVPVMFHDGEESDTTLMPFYGYLPYDNPLYKNYTRFAASRHNVAYNPETRGIIWETYGENAGVKTVGPRVADATFPGYITALANVVHRESMVGTDGYMTEIRRLTDLDGSLWWWPYEKGARRGEVSARKFTESGWATGVFVSLFVSDFLGLRYDAPAKTITFRPFSPSSDFEWRDVRLGSGRFDAVVRRKPDAVMAELANHNSYAVTADIELILPEGQILKELRVGPRSGVQPQRTCEFLGHNTAAVRVPLKPGETIAVEATGSSR